MKAHLRYFSKSIVHGHYLVKLSIHDVGVTEKYPDGIKYGLICKNLKTGKQVLLDNHHPKGPHVHINENEFAYDYVNDDQLIEDFKQFVLNELGVKL